jgi:hypothetical protein
MAMTVMAIGGAAVITMQKTSVTGNLDARKADVANSIARTWVERLQRESMSWTQPGNLANANVLNSVVATSGAWFLPVQDMGSVPETASPGFDILGRDLALTDLPNADFCVNVRLTWLTVPPAAQDLMRADVRVIWPIGIINSLPGFCNAQLGATDDPNTGKAIVDKNADPNAPIFHAIYLTTTLKENGQ